MVLALLGVSIGLGNFWRFPYMMGIFGGGGFLVIYLAVVVTVGVPAMLAELTLGRMTRRGPFGAFASAGLPAGQLRAVRVAFLRQEARAGGDRVREAHEPELGRRPRDGVLLFFGVGMAMTYYLVVLGWILAFFVEACAGLLGLADPGPESFGRLHGSWPTQLACSAVVAAAAATVVARGVRSGIERISRVFLPVFGALTLFLAAWALTLPGAIEGVRYLFTVDFSILSPRSFLAAFGQAFFSLGLGGTFLVIYGSYLPADAPLSRRAASTAFGDVFASLIAVLVMMPIAFVFGLSPASGPPLLFEVMPAAFVAMRGGAFFGTLFFLGLGCIAFLSGVAAVEVLVGSIVESRGWNRTRTSVGVCAVLALLGLPAMFSLDYIIWSDLLWGSTMQPIGSVAAVLALAWGAGRQKARAELALSIMVAAIWCSLDMAWSWS